MAASNEPGRAPGATILGGSAGGFSYEGARNDAWARQDAQLKPTPIAHETAKLPPKLPAPRAEQSR